MLILTRRVGETLFIDNPAGAIGCTTETITVAVPRRERELGKDRH